MEQTKEAIIDFMHYYGRKIPHIGYGQNFSKWLEKKQRTPYGSFGNGSAMRVSPVAFAFNTFDEVEGYAKISAEVTHNHPEGIKGACSTAIAIFMARNGSSKEEIKEVITRRYGYNLERTLAEIRPYYEYNESCQQTVPEALTAFFESTNFEDSIRKAVSLGGDSDTLAAITGSVAEAYYGKIPSLILKKAIQKLRMCKEIDLVENVNTWYAWLEDNKVNKYK